ncbi:hypothetical protein ANT2_4387 [plant metagenome]|uniref:Uncharacterized protein n=1 Tax=plant metagenome TaxID=1297885 RepID=A0A484QXF6_9ZZZZ
MQRGQAAGGRGGGGAHAWVLIDAPGMIKEGKERTPTPRLRLAAPGGGRFCLGAARRQKGPPKQTADHEGRRKANVALNAHPAVRVVGDQA